VQERALGSLVGANTFGETIAGMLQPRGNHGTALK
jgi:hypothetical protein